MDTKDISIDRNIESNNERMPVLFTSHGNPMSIILSREEHSFWNELYRLGKELRENYNIKAALVVSAHWVTDGTLINIASEQKQIFDYYGFPEEYYKVEYKAKGAPDIAKRVKEVIPTVEETTDWGLDHGAWPVLMHLFPKGDIPVFQLSIDNNASPDYHFKIGNRLKILREQGVLIIGSGSLIHNLSLLGEKYRNNDNTSFEWEAPYEAWIKEQIEKRNFENLINYETSHPAGKLASPTPEHYIPLLYALGLVEEEDTISYFYEKSSNMPAFSESSFIIK